MVRQTTALAPGTDGPVKVTGGRASGEVTWPVYPGPGSVLCQEGPAEEGGASSHPRSTVTHCHTLAQVYLSLARVEQGSPRVAARKFCWDWVAVVQPRRVAELWVGSHSLFAALQTTLAPRRAEATIPSGPSLGAQAVLGRRRIPAGRAAGFEQLSAAACVQTRQSGACFLVSARSASS